MSRIGQNYSRIRIHVENTEQKYSTIKIHGENIEQNYSRIRIHGENRTKLFENQNSWRESEKSIRESKFMARIEQKYSRIRIHVENRTKLFENQNTKNATCAARLEIQNGGIGKHQCKPRCSRISTFFG